MKHLAIRLPNWLGDVIMALPTLTALTSAGITFELFGKPWIKDFFSAYDYHIHVLPSNFWQARETFKKTKTSDCVLLTNGLSSALHLVHTGIRTIGYRANGRQLFLQHSLKKQSGLHEIEYFWQLTQFAVNQDLLSPQEPRLVISDYYLEQAVALLKKHQIKKEFVVICPGSTGTGINKMSKVWPHWQSLTDTLLQEGKQVIACPGPFENSRFKQELAKEVCILPDLNIPMFAAIMKCAAKVIANDSGPMHLAAAVQTPVLGIFGQSDPQRCRPWGGEFIGGLFQWPSCEEVSLRFSRMGKGSSGDVLP